MIALSKYYNHFGRERLPSPKPHSRPAPVRTDSLQRIYLLPTPTSPSSSSFNFDSKSHARSRSMDEVIVYAPVPLGGLSEQEARNLNATEAWVSVPADTCSSPTVYRTHRHSRSHPHSHSHHSHRQHSRPQRSSSQHFVETNATREEKQHLLIDTSV